MCSTAARAMLDKASHAIETYGRYFPFRLDLVYRHYDIGFPSASFGSRVFHAVSRDTPYRMMIDGCVKFDTKILLSSTWSSWMHRVLILYPSAHQLQWRAGGILTDIDCGWV